MTGLVAIFIILLVVIIVINIKGIGKTFSNTDFRKFEINEKDKYIKIGDKICKFSDITSVSVNECEEQVTALETIFQDIIIQDILQKFV